VVPITSYDLTLDAAVVTGNKGSPEAAHGRGFYFTNLDADTNARTYFKITPLVRPLSYAMVIWYKASNFDSIATGYCDFEGGETNFEITK